MISRIGAILRGTTSPKFVMGETKQKKKTGGKVKKMMGGGKTSKNMAKMARGGKKSKYMAKGGMKKSKYMSKGGRR